MGILLFKYEQAKDFSRFIAPGVLDMYDREGFWYIGEADETHGLSGMLVIDPRQDLAAVLSIGVSPECSRQGIAGRLLQYAFTLLRKQHILDVIATYVLIGDEWTPLDGLLRKNGFDMAPEDRFYVFAGQLDALKAQTYPERPDSELVSLRRIDDVRLERVAEILGAHADFRPEGIMLADMDCSMICWEEGEPRGVLLFHEPTDYEMEMLWLWTPEEHPDPEVVECLLGAAARAAARRYEDETVLYLRTPDRAAAERLALHMPQEGGLPEERTYQLSLI